MEETSTDEEVGVVQDHTAEDEDTCAQRGDEELLAGADAAEEATTETADEHQTPVDGSEECCIRRLEVEALTIEVDVVPDTDFDTDIHEDSDDTESEVREAPYALFEDFTFLLLCTCDRWKVELRESCDKNASVNLILLLALSHYMENYQLVEATEELQDYLRVVRNLLWGVRQLDKMRYESNVRINSLLNYWGWIEPLASRKQVLDAVKSSGEVFLKKKKENGKETKSKSKLHQRVDFILRYPELKPLIGELEDHPLLAGQLGIFDLNLALDVNEFKRQAEAFKLIFDPAFCARGDADKLIIRALVASGYPGVQGKNVWGGYRDTWFFGGNGRWSTVLSIKEYEQSEQRKAIRQLLSQFAGGMGDAKERLLRIIDAYLGSEDAKQRGWRYYFVKYPEFYSGDTNFFAWDNREETADAYVDSLKSFSSNPLIGYHANAYVQVVWRLVGRGDTHCRPEWVQGAKDSRLHLVRSGIYIGHTPEGWRIDLPQGYVLPEEIMHEFELSPSNLILRTPTADRIERAVAFCRCLTSILD